MDNFSGLYHEKMWPEQDIKHFGHLNNKVQGSRKSIWGPKMSISASYELNLAIYGLSRLENSLVGPFSWFMPWEMWPETDLKHFRHLNNNVQGSGKSIWGPKRPISVSYELNLAIQDLSMLDNSLFDHFSDLCHGKCGQKHFVYQMNSPEP